MWRRWHFARGKNALFAFGLQLMFLPLLQMVTTELMHAQLFGILGLGATPLCVDIGAWDGKHLSNTYSLLHGANGVTWGGVLVEANADRCAEMSKLYEGRSDVLCMNTLVSFEGDSSLDS